MSEQCNEQWIVVKSKKRKFIEKQVKIDRIQIKGGKKLLQSEQVEAVVEDFLNSSTYTFNKILLEKIVQVNSQIVEVNCLGLGNFLSEYKPFLQWLFFKQVILKVFHEKRCIICKLNIYDPVFNNQQKEEVRKMNSSSHQLKQINQGHVQFMYMPHCERNLHELVCSLKLKNPQTKFFVIGNSISEYKSRSTLLQQPIHNSFQNVNCTEYKIKDYKQAFNDMYIYQL